MSAELTRLSVNLAPTTAAALKAYMVRRDMSATEAIRHAIAVLDLVSAHQAVGAKVIFRNGRSEHELVVEL